MPQASKLHTVAVPLSPMAPAYLCPWRDSLDTCAGEPWRSLGALEADSILTSHLRRLPPTHGLELCGHLGSTSFILKFFRAFTLGGSLFNQ